MEPGPRRGAAIPNRLAVPKHRTVGLRRTQPNLAAGTTQRVARDRRTGSVEPVARASQRRTIARAESERCAERGAGPKCASLAAAVPNPEPARNSTRLARARPDRAADPLPAAGRKPAGAADSNAFRAAAAGVPGPPEQHAVHPAGSLERHPVALAERGRPDGPTDARA